MTKKKTETQPEAPEQTKAPRSSKHNPEQLADTVLFHKPCEIAYCEEGHSGPGYYVWSTEYPEEGASFLCNEPAILCDVLAELADRIET